MASRVRPTREVELEEEDAMIPVVRRRGPACEGVNVEECSKCNLLCCDTCKDDCSGHGELKSAHFIPFDDGRVWPDDLDT